MERVFDFRAMSKSDFLIQKSEREMRISGIVNIMLKCHRFKNFIDSSKKSGMGPLYK